MTSITETQPCIVTEEFTYVTIMEVYMKMAFFFFIQLHRKKKKEKREGSEVKIEREKCFLIASLTLHNISLQIGTKWLLMYRNPYQSDTSISSGLQISAYAICRHEYA